MKIELDIDDLINELNLPTNTSDLVVSNAVDAVTDEIFRNWRLEASNELTSTRNDYLNGLQVVNNSMFSKTIVLKGKLNNMVEKGVNPFDMKANFQKSRKAKQSVRKLKGGGIQLGWYLTIPFRIGIPTTIGDNSAFSGTMPKEVHDVAKKMPANTGLKKSQIASPYDIPKSRKAIKVPSKQINIPAYKHKSGIYEGMVKKVGAYGKTSQNTYMTFRRVSDNSDPNSWIHKGIKAHNLLGKAINSTDVSTVSENSVDSTLASLGYGN